MIEAFPGFFYALFTVPIIDMSTLSKIPNATGGIFDISQK